MTETTIIVQGVTYTVDRSCDADGRPRTFLIDQHGRTAASVLTSGAKPWILGGPPSWKPSDIHEAIRRLGY